MAELQQEVIARHIKLIGKTVEIIEHLAAEVTQEEATTWRDSGDGWTVVETLCHLRDYDEIFHERARLMRDAENPLLPQYDHDLLVIERNYNGDQLDTVMATLKASRARFVTFFKELPAEAWTRTGMHQEYGEITLLTALMQVGHHDVNHIEQLTRIVREKRVGEN